MEMTLAIHEQILRVLRDFPEVTFAILFGSFAQGTQNPESDVDLGVASLQGPLGRERFHALKEALTLSCARPVDLIDLQATQGPILHECLAFGKVLLGERSDTHCMAVMKMVWWQDDFAPLFRRSAREVIQSAFFKESV